MAAQNGGLMTEQEARELRAKMEAMGYNTGHAVVQLGSSPTAFTVASNSPASLNKITHYNDSARQCQYMTPAMKDAWAANAGSYTASQATPVAVSAAAASAMQTSATTYTMTAAQQAAYAAWLAGH